MVSSPSVETQIRRLASLFRRRWALPALIEVHRCDGARRASLSNRLWRASRQDLRDTLEVLQQQGLIVSGESRRYAVTPSGETVARAGGRLLFQLRKLGVERVALRKWSLPVVFALGESAMRFNELHRKLPMVTSRVLAVTLRALQRGKLVDRYVFLTYAPRTLYRLTPQAQQLIPLLVQLQLRSRK